MGLGAEAGVPAVAGACVAAAAGAAAGDAAGGGRTAAAGAADDTGAPAAALAPTNGRVYGYGGRGAYAGGLPRGTARGSTLGLSSEKRTP